jgi:hypothetical protein
MRNPIPYPLRAMRLDLSLAPFGFWLVPTFTYRRELRWAWFQISYGRWT